MKPAARRVWILVFSAVFVFGVLRLALYTQDRQTAEDSGSAALELALPAVTLPEERVPLTDLPGRLEELSPPPAPEQPPQPTDEIARWLLSVDLDALREVNPDVLGWIHIPDSTISFPLMEADDNNEYLYHTWDKQPSKYGSIFLECRNSRELTDFNTLIYGHNMLTEHMFGTLTDYKEQSFLDAHPTVYIRTDSGVFRYRVFSVYEAEVVSNTYRLIFEDDARRQQALELYTSSNWLETDIVPAVTDRILTLSTCTGRGTDHLRFVVQAVLEDVIS